MAEAVVDKGEGKGYVGTVHGEPAGDNGGSGTQHVHPNPPPKDGAKTFQGDEQSSHKLNSHAKSTGEASGHHQKFD
jgi:hypothetical protein